MIIIDQRKNADYHDYYFAEFERSVVLDVGFVMILPKNHKQSYL